MKKLIGLGLALALFSSCSDDDSSVNMDNLIGKWYYVSVTANGETELYDDHEVCGKDYIEFSADGTLTSVDVWDCDGTTPVTDVESVMYTTSGNKITAMASGLSSTVTVTKLTSGELEISYRGDDDGDGDEETVIDTYSSTP